jgi:hypothetical protein
MFGKRWMAGVICVVLASAVASNAAVMTALIGPPTGSSFQDNTQYIVGYTFNVTAAMGPTSVTAVGVYDFNHDGLATDHPITFVDETTSTDLSSWMPTVGPLSNPTGTDDFIYVPLATAYPLTVGHTYLLEESAHFEGFFNPDSGHLTTTASSFIGGIHAYYNGLNDAGAGGFVGPNLLIAIPEPASLASMAIIGSGLMVMRRKQS